MEPRPPDVSSHLKCLRIKERNLNVAKEAGIFFIKTQMDTDGGMDSLLFTEGTKSVDRTPF